MFIVLFTQYSKQLVVSISISTPVTFTHGSLFHPYDFGCYPISHLHGPPAENLRWLGDRALQSAVRGGITDGRMVLYDHPRPVRHTGALYHITVTLSSCACYGTPQEVGRAHQCRVWKLGMVLSDVFSGCHSKSVNSKSAISRASLIMFECSTRSSVSVGDAFRRSISTLQKQDEWTS